MSRSHLRWTAAIPVLVLLTLALGLGLAADSLSDLLTRRTVDTIKPALAFAGTGLLVAQLWLDRHGRGRRLRRLRDGALVAVALASALAWWNFLQFHYPRHIHVSDTYHYYVGAKYFSELGYTRLYACTAVADAEAAPATGVADRNIRDLATNEMISAAVPLAEPEACKRHFSETRWRAFRHDVDWFRGLVTPRRWGEIQRDHGYNPPPSWGLLGGRLANLGPAGPKQLAVLGLIDPLLLAGMFASIAWAFGWRVLCVAVIYWGTNFFGVFGWTGGSLLRQGWLVTAVSGVCCLRKGRPTAAGALLTVSTLVRIFPGVILATLALRAAVQMGRQHRFALEPSDRRIALGAALAFAVVFPLATWTHGGLDAWFDFVENSRVHLGTALKNHVGLATVLSYDPSALDRLSSGGDPMERYEAWSAAREARFSERRWLHRAALMAFLVLISAAASRDERWVAAALGIGAIPMAFELTNYYYAILVGFAPLAARRREIGAALCGLSGLSWVIAGTFQWRDEIMTWCSAMVVFYVVWCTARIAWGPAPTPEATR
ncbi:MAG: hypothetical protein ACE5FL_01585 [Myxococcota bacterium]